jgi:hypothetical protein
MPWCSAPAHRVRGGGAHAGESGERVVGRAEAEIVQHQHDLLAVVAKLCRIMDDERRRHQALLPHPLMRVHLF